MEMHRSFPLGLTGSYIRTVILNESALIEGDVSAATRIRNQTSWRFLREIIPSNSFSIGCGGASSATSEALSAWQRTNTIAYAIVLASFCTAATVHLISPSSGALP